MKVRKAIEISDAKIQYVSLVDKAANKRNFLVAKARGAEDGFSRYGKILKVDCGMHYVTGVVYEPFVEDAHGNFMSGEEIRKAAYRFAKNGEKVDLQHSFESADGLSVVENYIAPCDMVINGERVVEGTWLITVEVQNAEVWAAVTENRITGFSMGGFGKYSGREMLIEQPDSNKDSRAEADGKQRSEEDFHTAGGKQGIFKKAAVFLGFAQDAAEEREVCDLTGNEIQAMVDAAVAKALERTEVLSAEEIAALVDERLEAALESAVEKAVSPLLKSRSCATNLNSENAPQKKAGHFLEGIL